MEKNNVDIEKKVETYCMEKKNNVDIEKSDLEMANGNLVEVEKSNLEIQKSNLEVEKSNVNAEKLRIIKIRRVIYYIFGFLEVLFAFRLVFKILGANTESTFVSIIYSITNLFLAPFNGIFRVAVSSGIETKSILEPTLIIAMVVYALLAWGIVKLIEIISNRKHSETL